MQTANMSIQAQAETFDKTYNLYDSKTNIWIKFSLIEYGKRIDESSKLVNIIKRQ